MSDGSYLVVLSATVTFEKATRIRKRHAIVRSRFVKIRENDLFSLLLSKYVSVSGSLGVRP